MKSQREDGWLQAKERGLDRCFPPNLQKELSLEHLDFSLWLPEM